MADRAGRSRSGFIAEGSRDRCHAEQTPTERQVIFAGSVGEPAEVPDLHKSGRKDMLQETAEKLHGLDRHDADLIIPIVPPAEAHLAIIEGDEPRVRDSDPVRVPREIFQNLLRAAKGRFGIDYPL